MKRIIALIITLSLFVSFFAFAQSETTLISAAPVEKKFESELGFLEKIGISDIGVLSKDQLTRGEFTSLVVNVFYPENVFDGEYDQDNLFTDIDETHIYYPEIKAARGLGIVKGSGASAFLPDKEMAYNDALTVLINALGYGYLAEANGGYPTGYMVAARNIELSKGISNTSPVLSGDVAAKLIYNALFVDSADFASVDKEGNITVAITPDENLLSRKYNIFKYDAKVVATPLSSVEGDASSTDTVILKQKDDSKYIVWSAESGIEKELGKKLTVYVKRNPDNGKDEVVFYRDFKGMKVDTVIGDEIINVTNSYVEYEPSYGKFEKISTESYPDILFNGVLLTEYNNELIKPENGFVTFIDADGNGKAETISIVSFNFSGMNGNIPENNNPALNLVVDEVNVDKLYISCKWNPRNNLDLDEDEVIYTIISKDDTITKLSDIEKNDILSVAKAPAKVDGKDVYFIYAERKSVKDIYNSVNTEENIIDINGVEYKVSSSLYSVKAGYYNNMVNGNDITVYLDYTGKIAYIEDVKRVTNNYSYIISAAERITGGENTLVIKLLEYTNTVNTYNVSSKAKIDGKTYDNASAQYSAIAKRPENYQKWKDENGVYYETAISRPAIVKFNDNKEIISINTDNPDYLTVSEKAAAGLLTSVREKNIYTDFNGIGYSNEEVMDNSTLKAGLRVPRVGAYRAKATTVEGRFFINSETYVFTVPDIDTCGISDYTAYASNPKYSYADPNREMMELFEKEKVDSNYKVVLSSTLEDGVLYDIQAYNIDPDTGVAEMVILRGNNGISAEETGEQTGIFLRKTEYYNPATESNMTKIYYTVDGEKELYAIVDSEDLFLPFDYIINGRSASDEDNIYDVDIPALKKGDFIRVATNGEKLLSVQRIVILNDLETKTLASFSYGRKATGYQSSDANRRLFDVNATDWGGNASTLNNFVLIPEKVKGSLVHGIMSGTVDKKYYLSDINVNDPSTYISQMIDFSGMTPVVLTVTKTESGIIKDVKVEKGDLNDIVTFDDAESFKTASRIIFRHTDFAVYNMFIVNYEIAE